jgi:hypothetical protein
MRWIRVIVPLLVVLLIAGCGGSNKKIKAPKAAQMKVPEWYVDPPANDNQLVGVATATSLDLQTAVDKAKQDGRTEIARQMDIRISGMSKRFVEETGLNDDAELLGMFTQVSRSVVSDSLTGSQVAKQELLREGDGYRAYVMMAMPIGEANAKLVQKIKAQERLYTRFRASEAFEELDALVQEYEEWKKQQGGLGK